MLTVPSQLNAAELNSNAAKTDSVTVVDVAMVNSLLARLDEIVLMDKKSLNSTERRELREEVRTINKAVKAASNGGIFISVGTIVLILILLIILL